MLLFHERGLFGVIYVQCTLYNVHTTKDMKIRINADIKVVSMVSLQPKQKELYLKKS